MNTLNLIYPEKSTLAYTAMVYPDGQPHIKLDASGLKALNRQETLRIYSRVSTPGDLLLLLFAKETLDYAGFERVELSISYLLAARMDRVMNEGEPFSLRTVARMINAAGFRRVYIFDPHSEVSTALIERSYPVWNHAFAKEAIDYYFSNHHPERFSLVSPDAGALKKIHKLAQYLDIEDVVECMKERDIKTGELLRFETIATDLSGHTCIIVDDICDGGGTFAGTAKTLREKGADKVVLIVSHGIFSKGTNIQGVDAVYTTDSYRRVEGVECFEVGKYLG